MEYKSKKDCENFLKKTWDDLKNDLEDGKVLDNDTKSLLQYTFFKQFDDMFGYMYEANTIEIKNIKQIYRGVGCYTNDLDRFIPRKEYASLNRFNPPDKVFIYLGVSTDDAINSLDIKRGCIKELRSKSGDRVSFCKFIPSNKKILDKKVVDLTIADNKTFEQLIYNLSLYSSIYHIPEFSEKSDLVKFIQKKDPVVYSFCKILMQIYNKMISDQIFLQVDNLDKEYEYKPFHEFANYCIEKGYVGIVYKSTVSPGNKNLALFNVNDMKPTGKISHKTIK